MTRQPSLPAKLLRAAEAVKLSDRSRAPVWMHLGAMLEHAASVGLVEREGSLHARTDALAALHPRLGDVAAIAAEMTTADAESVTTFWAGEQLPGDNAALWPGHVLGDLYQALSSEARKERALCQTPWWVAELLLAIALRRAEETWPEPRIIDPSCGTGHLLVESYMHTRKGLTEAETLARIAGVDLDPYAALVARYRLLVLAWASLQHRADRQALADLPLQVNQANALLSTNEPLLARGTYHVVIGNPPYIVPPDAKDRDAIRARYREVCSGKYSLALPFTVLMTELAVEGGYIAQLTTNAWMKREYGKPFVTDYLPRLELVWIINSAGAYIPGHGTPTCILVHRNMPASGRPVLTVMSKRGEPSTPAEPEKGLVWSSIRQVVLDCEADARFERRQTQPQPVVATTPTEQTIQARAKQLAFAFGLDQEVA